jgi:hypothetical protein
VDSMGNDVSIGALVIKVVGWGLSILLHPDNSTINIVKPYINLFI